MPSSFVFQVRNDGGRGRRDEAVIDDLMKTVVGQNLLGLSFEKEIPVPSRRERRAGRKGNRYILKPIHPGNLFDEVDLPLQISSKSGRRHNKNPLPLLPDLQLQIFQMRFHRRTGDCCSQDLVDS